MLKKLIIIISIYFLYQIPCIAQSGQGRGSFQGERPKIGVLVGKVLESNTKEPLGLANVILYSIKDSIPAAGGFTEKDGTFSISKIPVGFYYCDIKYIGFETRRIPDLKFLPNNPNTDLGEVLINASSVRTDDVIVTADREKYVYQLDKKVINITNDIANNGGTAVDALERAPSVNVDIEGNVSLRGSSNFNVFVNGKPSVLTGTDALNQIPISSIDHIELITNPSAKYDPDGMSGIINVVLIEDAGRGVAGQIASNLGNYDNYGTDAKFTYGTGKLNLSFGANYSSSYFFHNSSFLNEIYRLDTTTMRTSDANGRFNRRNFNLSFGGNYEFNQNFYSNLEIGLGQMEFDRKFHSDIFNGNNFDLSQYSISNSIADNERDFYSINYGLSWKINQLGQKLDLGFFTSNRSGISADLQDEFLSSPDWNLKQEGIFGNRASEDDISRNYRIQLDYVLPISDATKFEAGVQARIDRDDETFEQYFLDVNSGSYEFSELFSNRMLFSNDIYSIYFTYRSKLDFLSYQIGLRSEATHRVTEFDKSIEPFTLDLLDWFPSLHLSTELSKGNQLMASYSRRINRPRGRELDPFPSYRDSYNYRIGNPQLEPEYTDSYEAGFLTYSDKLNISIEAYLRNTSNQIERFSSLDTNGIFSHTALNLSNSRAYGVEISANYTPVKWFNIGIVPNFFRYEISGDIVFETASTSTETWNLRLFGDITLLENLKAEANAMLTGPTITAQGERAGFTTVDAGLRFDILQKKLSFILSARDIFNGNQFNVDQVGDSFRSSNQFNRVGQIMVMTINYRFNDYESDRRNRGGGSSGEDGGMEMF